MPEARIPAGMRDILPGQMLKRQYVLDIVRSIFEEFGFEPLQTSAIELTETLSGKYGEDAERLIYKAWYGDQPDGDVSLRYDLSVPLCRVVAMYPDLPRPFKRYQIAPVWRADRPAKGRYREFYQCDVDIVGTESMLADAEIAAIIYTVLNRLGFTEFVIAVNNRKILDGIGRYAGVPDSLLPGLYRSIDKTDKIGLEGVRGELMMVGVPREPREPLQRTARLAMQGKLPFDDMERYMVEDEDLDSELAKGLLAPMQTLVQEGIAADVPPGELQAYTRGLVNQLGPQLRDHYGKTNDIIPTSAIERLIDLLKVDGPNADILDDLETRLADSPRAMQGISELRQMFAYLDTLGIPGDTYQISFAMVRGLEYYTGPIFETTVTEPKAMPSITGGGRYDELIGLFADVSYPAVGTSFGIERIIDAMDELDMYPDDVLTTTSQVLVTVFNEETTPASLKAVSRLRDAGINTTLYYDPADRLGDQIGFAASKGIPFVVIIGPDELEQDVATIRLLGETRKDSEQRTVTLDRVAQEILNW